MGKKTILLIVAKHYAGKTTLSTIAKNDYGDNCHILHARPIIEASLNDRNEVVDRTSIRNEGQRLQKVLNDEGYPFIMDAFMKQIEDDSNKASLFIVDSIYHPKSMERWRKWCQEKGHDCRDVAIITCKKKRFELARIREGVAFSIDQLKAIDDLEITVDPEGQHIDMCIEMSIGRIHNEFDLESYQDQIRQFLSA